MLALQTLRFREVLDVIFNRCLHRLQYTPHISRTTYTEINDYLSKDKRDSLLYLYSYGLHSLTTE